MKKYIKSAGFTLLDRQDLEEQYYEEKDILYEEFAFHDTIIPIIDGDIADEGWDILSDCCISDNLYESSVPIMIDNGSKNLETIDGGIESLDNEAVLEGIRDSLLDAIPNLPLEGKCNIKVNGDFVLKFPFTYKETYNRDWEEYIYSNFDIAYTPGCEIKNFSYKIL